MKFYLILSITPATAGYRRIFADRVFQYQRHLFFEGGGGEKGCYSLFFLLRTRKWNTEKFLRDHGNPCPVDTHKFVITPTWSCPFGPTGVCRASAGGESRRKKVWDSAGFHRPGERSLGLHGNEKRPRRRACPSAGGHGKSRCSLAGQRRDHLRARPFLLRLGLRTVRCTSFRCTCPAMYYEYLLMIEATAACWRWFVVSWSLWNSKIHRLVLAGEVLAFGLCSMQGDVSLALRQAGTAVVLDPFTTVPSKLYMVRAELTTGPASDRPAFALKL